MVLQLKFILPFALSQSTSLCTYFWTQYLYIGVTDGLYEVEVLGVLRLDLTLKAFKRKIVRSWPKITLVVVGSDFGDLLGHNHWVGGGDLGLSESSVVEVAVVLVAVSVDATVHPSAPGDTTVICLWRERTANWYELGQQWGDVDVIATLEWPKNDQSLWSLTLCLGDFDGRDGLCQDDANFLPACKPG